LIFAGDFQKSNTDIETDQFVSWINKLEFNHKIIVPGNHDKNINANFISKINAHVLLNSAVEISGVKILGFAFNKKPDDWELDKYPDAFWIDQEDFYEECNKLCANFDFCDILITHMPPFNVLDQFRNKPTGSHKLKMLSKFLHPEIHAFGHIHESFGICHDGLTTYINCSMIDAQNKKLRNPICLYFKKR